MATNFFTERERREFKFSRALQAISEDRLTGSLEGEMLTEAAQRAGKPFTAGQIYLPFELMRRDLDISSGAHLVATETPAAYDVLRPSSKALRAGAQILDVVGNQSIPKVTGTSTAQWLQGDGSGQITESQITVGEVGVTPKNCGILTEVSQQLTRQTNIDALLQRELLRSMGSALDAAILVGTGIAGQPLGIHNTPGIYSHTGYTDWEDVLGMLQAVEEANADNVTWFAPPAMRTFLSSGIRATPTGSEIWNDGKICGLPVVSSTLAPAASLTCGDFSQVLIAMFGDGLEITINPFSNFATGKIAYRAWLTADVSVITPAAFAVATSIT